MTAGGTHLKTIARIVFAADEQLHRLHPTKAEAYTNYDGQVWALAKVGDYWELELSNPATKKLYPLARG